MLSISRLDIHNIGRIQELTLEFSPGLNLVCGPNGIGKTTILECIGHAFSWANGTLTRRADSADGSYAIEAKENGKQLQHEFKCNSFAPQKREHQHGLRELVDQVVVLKANRAFAYQKVQHVNPDPSDQNRADGMGIAGISFSDIKPWLVNRSMWEPHSNVLKDSQRANLELAKRTFSELDQEVQFSRVLGDTFDVMVTTPAGEIYFEYLSSGFISCICLVLGLIKEIEYRFQSPTRCSRELRRTCSYRRA